MRGCIAGPQNRSDVTTACRGRQLRERGQHLDGSGVGQPVDPRGDPGSGPAALLAAIHGHLMPGGLLADAEAGALARAGEAARAFASVTIAPPDSLIAAIAADAGALVARARIAVANV